MWTDEQLRAQGWTDGQIAVHRSEEASTSVSEVIQPEEIETMTSPVNDSIDLSKAMGTPFLSSNAIIGILLASMLVLVPFSLYSISNAEGIEGASGEDGISGLNGTDGSSFHLVASSETLPSCEVSINNQIFFIAAESSFQVCQDATWSMIDLTGESGTDGQNGTNGFDGFNGSNGSNGTDGENGLNGLTSLIVSKAEPNGVNCPNGGTRVETGIDDNNDNFLSTTEVDSFVFVCNGEEGQDGSNGQDGTNGQDGINGQNGQDGADGSSTPTTMVATLSIAPSYMGCNGTGQLFKQGIDNGAGNGIAQNGILETGEILYSTLICTTFIVDQIHDINPGTLGSNPSDFVTINSTMYFIASNGATSGIWSLDENDSLSLEYSGSVLSLRAIGSQLMFAGQGQGLNVKPYVYEPSNGTAWQITEIFPGGSSYPGEFTLIGTTVFFSARDSTGSTGIGLFDLWAYETLNYSVWKVEADIQPTSLIAVNSDLYFSAGLNNGNVELWKHETFTNTTFMVKDINPGILASSPENLVLMGTTIYMSANDGSGAGTELQAYNINNNSTWVAADIRPNAAASMPSDLVVLGTQVYMKASSGTYFELWVYDSQNNSFWEVSNIQSTSGFGGPTGLTVNEYTVYFSADDGTNGEELWAHNSINGTTWLVIDLHPSGGSVLDIHVINGDVYFSADDGSTGIELWKLIFSKVVTYV